MTIYRVRGYVFLINVFLIYLVQIVSTSAGLEADISLNVEGNGFHRNFIYQVQFNDVTKACHAAIHLDLPPALYVNVDELADLRRLGSTTACSIGETDVELFMGKANSQNVTICAPVTGTECTLKLPIHQRYQYAKENGGYTTVTLPKPTLLLGCKDRIKEHRVSKIDLCSPCVELVPKWREIPYNMDQDDFVWLVPVGDSSMLTMITYVTLLTTILGAMFITRTIWKSTLQEHEKEE